MAERILIDSNCYIGWLRQRMDYEHTLRPWLNESALHICGVVRAEVLRGIINPAQKVRTAAFFDVMPEIPTDSQLWRKAADLCWQLDREGKILPLTDVVIALCAMKVDAMVISPNGYFGEIEGLRWRRELPPL